MQSLASSLPYIQILLSILMAFYHFVVFAYIWDKNKFIDEKVQGEKILQDELKIAQREMRFWVDKKKSEEEKNLLIRLILKVKSKLHL